MENKIFVVDGNWYLHRAWFTLRTKRDIGLALGYAMTGMVAKDACLVKATHILVAFDGANIFRHGLTETYKSNRVKEETVKPAYNEDSDEEGGKDVYEYLPAVRNFLTNAGIAWVQKKKFEADDVLASAADQYPGKKILGAKDKDQYQVLSPLVRMFDSSNKPEPRWITQAIVEKKKGVSVSQMVDFQTLVGDKIDNIKSFKSEAKARAILKEYGSIKNWFAKADKEERMWLKVNQVELALNKRLVHLVRDLDLPDLETLVVPKLVREDMPKAWHIYQEWKYPKMKGLFK